MTTVLVTGAGTLLAQGIIRAMRLTGRPLRIVTADPDARAAGHWLGDTARTLPVASDPAYVASLEEIVGAERVDIVLPGTDVELPVLSRCREELERRYAVRVLVSDPRVVEIADDKWLTARFLAEHGFPAPRSALATDEGNVARLAEEFGFPLFAKPRRGARSVGARVIESRSALAVACAREPSLVVQELLPGDEGEYTAGSIVVEGKCHGVVTLRRDLRDGNTFRAYREDAYGRFDRFLASVSETLGAHGPCNLQFRLRRGEPVIFEINARFSGTTPIRAIFGFNELAAVLDWFLDGTPIPAPRLSEGTVLRTTGDLLIERSALERLRAEGRLDGPRAIAVPFLISPRRSDDVTSMARQVRHCPAGG